MGQNFAKAFEIQYLGQEGVLENAYTNSWGVSTRLIGAIIMTHGDARGLVLPPVVAPTQVVIVPIAARKPGVNEACEELKAELEAAGIRVVLDNTDNSPGWKFNEWEMKGVPVRIEIGPRDIENNQVMVARRDNLEKQPMSMDNIADTIVALLDTVQNIFENPLEVKYPFEDGVSNITTSKALVDDMYSFGDENFLNAAKEVLSADEEYKAVFDKSEKILNESGRISPENAKALFGDKIYSSPSRFECYSSCSH